MAYIRIVFCPISLKIFPLYGFTSKLVTFVRHCYFLFVPFSITTLLFSFSNSRKLTQIVHKLFIFLMTVPFFLAFSYVPNDWSIIGRSFVSIFFSSVLTGCSKSCSKLLSCRGTCRQEDYTTLSGCRAASEGFLYPSEPPAFLRLHPHGLKSFCNFCVLVFPISPTWSFFCGPSVPHPTFSAETAWRGMHRNSSCISHMFEATIYNLVHNSYAFEWRTFPFNI